MFRKLYFEASTALIYKKTLKFITFDPFGHSLFVISSYICTVFLILFSILRASEITSERTVSSHISQPLR